MGRGKAFILLGIYVFFVIYIVGRGAGNEWAQSIADGLVSMVHFFQYQLIRLRRVVMP